VRGDTISALAVAVAPALSRRACMMSCRAVPCAVPPSFLVLTHVWPVLCCAPLPPNPNNQNNNKYNDEPGPGAVLQSCTVENAASIGAGAVVMEGALVESQAIVSPGAVVHADQRIPSGEVWAGAPARFVRKITAEEAASTEGNAEAQADGAKAHAEMFFEEGAAYREAEGVGRGKILDSLNTDAHFVELKPEPKL